MNVSPTPAVRSEKDADGIVTIWLDDPDAGANTMNERYIAAMGDVIDQLEKDIADGGVKGSSSRRPRRRSSRAATRGPPENPARPGG